MNKTGYIFCAIWVILFLGSSACNCSNSNHGKWNTNLPLSNLPPQFPFQALNDSATIKNIHERLKKIESAIDLGFYTHQMRQEIFTSVLTAYKVSDSGKIHDEMENIQRMLEQYKANHRYHVNIQRPIIYATFLGAIITLFFNVQASFQVLFTGFLIYCAFFEIIQLGY